MSRGSNRHVHYDEDVIAKKLHRSSRRQRRRRRVSRRAKIYGAAFLLALTGFFCLVPGTSLTVVAFTNGTNSRESILKLLGPVFGGVGVCLVGISIGLVCYAVIQKRRSRKNKELRHLGYHQDVDDNGYQGSSTKNVTLTAEVRLLDADKENSTLKLQHKLVPNHISTGSLRKGASHGGDVVSPSSTVTVDIIQPPPLVTVSMTGKGETASAVALGSPDVTKESFQTDLSYENTAEVFSMANSVSAGGEIGGAAAALAM
ncbi:uncharacterized protein [Asterias amurensis]|uniref:uncharacterized protein n=1 Tax=Asterias amurensis TaxID=7602 RepID=UPI003AB8F901